MPQPISRSSSLVTLKALSDSYPKCYFDTTSITIQRSPSSSQQYFQGDWDSKTSRASREHGSDWYSGASIKASRTLGLATLAIPNPDTKRSRFSITPSAFNNGAGPVLLSNEQSNELARLRDHGDPMNTLSVGITTTEPPNGGIMAWLHVAAGFLVVFNSLGMNMSYGVFQTYYQETLLRKESPAKIAWIGSLQLFLIYFTSILVSPLMNKGHFRLCFSGGSILLIISVFATSFCRKWDQYHQLLLVQGLLTGLGMGLTYGSGLIVRMSYFSTKMGIASGYAASGASIGGIVWPLLAEHLIFQIGFAWTLRVFALVSIVTLLPANLITRERNGRPARPTTQMDWTALHDAPFMLMTTGLFFAFWGCGFGFYYIISYGRMVLGLSSTDSIELLVAMNAANLPGRFLPNFISDACIGPLNTIIPATFLAAMMIFLWIGTSTHASLLIVACFYGFSVAGINSLYNATIYSLSPDPGKAGVRMAIVFSGIAIASLTGTPIGGVLIDHDSGGFLSAQLFAGCTLIIGALFLLAARLFKSGWKPQRA